MKHEELTHQIIGAAMEVHNNLGSGYQEKIYQRALSIELQELGINFSREEEIDILYKGKVIGKRRVDFNVEEKVIVELKARLEIEGGHIVQTKNYLRIKSRDTALLINFGRSSLEWQRVFP